MSASLQPQLDHIVILVENDVLRSPPSWITDNFTISPGGQHADGLTENVLILLADGVYLELIAFTVTATPEARAKHRWGQLPNGIIDWAFTLPASDDVDAEYEALQAQWQAAGVDGRYTSGDLVAGARRRPDGAELKWRIAFPDGSKTGIANFWCFDITPRDLRVPLSPENTAHPSGATGLSGVTVKVTGEDEAGLRKLYESYPPASKEGGYQIGVPVQATAGSESRSFIRVAAAGDGETGVELHLSTRGERKSVRGDLGGKEVVLHFA